MKTNTSKEEGLASRSLGRRDLLKLGATGAVMPVVLGPTTVLDQITPEDETLASVVDLPAGPFALGFWDGKAESAIIDARIAGKGDQAFAKYGATITMIGMADAGRAAADCGLQCLDIDLKMGEVSLRTWSFASSPVLNVSSPATFSVPVEKKTGLQFSLRSLIGRANGTPHTANLKLTTGGDHGVAKLHEGYYVLAVGNNGRRFRMNWAGHRIAGDGTGQSLVLRNGSEVVRDMPYLIFTVALNKPDQSFV